jgi:hypothetical protein
MSTIKSSDEHLTLNADGSSKDIKFQANGVEKASISSAGAFTSKSLVVNGTNADLTLAASGNNISFARNSDNYITASGGSSSNLILDGQNRIVLKHNGTEKLRVTTDGLTFNGDTAAANALDDYEEGSFTPTLYGTLTAGSPTYTHQLGYYTKVGNLVHCIIRIYTTSIGTLNGQVRVGALPYTSINTSDTFSSVTCGYGAGLSMTAGNPMTGWIPNNSTYIRLTKWTSAAGTDYIDDAEWSGTGNVMISFTYQTA